jgi:hypothetical protein
VIVLGSLAEWVAAVGTVGALVGALYLLRGEQQLRRASQATRVSVWTQCKAFPAGHEMSRRQYFACISNDCDSPVYVYQMSVFPEVNTVAAGPSAHVGTVPPHERVEFALDGADFPASGEPPYMVIYFLDLDRVSWRRDSHAVLEKASSDAFQ